MWHWLLTRTVATTQDRAKVEKSFWTWLDDGSGVYRLRVVGILHSLTGYTYGG